MPTVQSIARELEVFWRRASRAERVGYLVGLLLLASGLVHVAILLITGGSWQGPLSLRKPATFGLSFGLTLITIAWVLPFLRIGARARSLFAVGFTIASVLETGLVSLQAWRGVPSHFNVETPFDEAVTRGLAGGGAALVTMVVALAVVSFRSNPAVPRSVQIAIRTGFVALCASMVVGATMIARGMLLVFSGHPQVAYASGGILKPMHAVTMHGILVLPALAWALTLTGWSDARQLKVLLLAATGYVALSATVVVANLAGLIH